MKRKVVTIFSRRAVSLGLFLAIAVPVIAAVASKRHYFEVPYEGERRLHARLDLSLGRVEIGRTDDEDFLFQAEVKIENEGMVPYFDYDTKRNEGFLDVDLESSKGKGSVTLSGLSSASSSEWLLLFGDQAPLVLDVELGAAKGAIDLTGLPVEEFRFDAGASRAEVRFDEPNPIVMDELDITAGASDVQLVGLGYARAKRVRFVGGVGRYTLDFSQGDLIDGARTDVEMGMAALRIVVPDNYPVVVHAPDNWLCSVDIPIGFTKRGKGIWFSEEADDADEPFRVSVEAGMGKITIAHP
jgi:hypothetical protein